MFWLLHDSYEQVKYTMATNYKVCFNYVLFLLLNSNEQAYKGNTSKELLSSRSFTTVCCIIPIYEYIMVTNYM